MKTRQGKECKKCGSTERYISSGRCAPCIRQRALEQYQKFPEILNARSRGYYANNSDTNRDYKFRAAYGITLEKYNQRLENQKHLCAICREVCISGRRLCVDHDHTNNSVRGLLCVNCNRAIGNLKDDPEMLRRAADYLEGKIQEWTE